MRRRDFLKLLGAGAAGAATIAFAPAYAAAPDVEIGPAQFTTADGRVFRLMRLRRGARAGDMVTCRGIVMGVAVCDVLPGHWTNVQIYGPCEMRIA